MFPFNSTFQGTILIVIISHVKISGTVLSIVFVHISILLH